MAYIPNIALIVVRRAYMPRLLLPGRGLGSSLDAMSRLLGDAFCMAYVDPYIPSDRRMPDEDHEGRNPRW